MLRELLPRAEVDAIYATFVRHTRERIALFRGGCNADAVAQEAHSLRGSAAMLGAGALAALASTLEEHGVSGELLHGHADSIEAALAAFTAALSKAGVCL